MLAHEDPQPQSRADSTLRLGKRSESYGKSKCTRRNIESPRPTRRRGVKKPLPTRKPSTPPRKMAQSDDLHPDCAAKAPQVGDEMPPLLRLVVFAFLSYCLFALKSGRTLESVTDDEFLQAIDKTFHCVFFESGSDASAAADGGDGSNDTGGASGSGWQQQSGESSTAAPTGATSRYSNFRAKRGREPDDDGHDEDPRKGKSPADYNARLTLESILGPLWACPYFWFDQDTYRDCLQHTLTRISDVRMHIKRRHTQDPHCPSCGLSFVRMNDPARDRHVRSRECEVIDNPDAAYPGATRDMIDQMNNRSDEGNDQTPSDRWYAIWTILFPGRDKPPHPYAPISEVAFATMSYLNRFIDSASTAEIQQMFPNDWSVMDGNVIFFLTRLRDFVLGLERQRESQRARTSGNGNRSRNGRPALLQPTMLLSQPGETPSLVSGSSQPTFTNNNNPPTEYGNAIGLQRPMPVLINNPSFASSDAQMGSQMSQCEHDDSLVQQLPSSTPSFTNNHAPSDQQAPTLVLQQPFPILNLETFDGPFTPNPDINPFGPGTSPSWASDQFQ